MVEAFRWVARELAGFFGEYTKEIEGDAMSG
jgi:hypothetical protein